MNENYRVLAKSYYFFERGCELAYAMFLHLQASKLFQTYNFSTGVNMTHAIPDDTLRLITEMDKKIGEFMQKRADVVNKLIYENAELQTGDFVKIYEGEEQVATGSIVQPLFLKRSGIVTYRVKRDDGEIFINEKFRLLKM